MSTSIENNATQAAVLEFLQMQQRGAPSWDKPLTLFHFAVKDAAFAFMQDNKAAIITAIVAQTNKNEGDC